KIKPAACPTLSANSGVIVPLARPRMPSVPKYFRAMCPRTRKTLDDRSIGRIVQNKGGFSARMANSRGTAAGSLVRNLLSLLVAAGRRRLRHVDRIGGGKAILEALFQRALEHALTCLLGLAL